MARRHKQEEKAVICILTQWNTFGKHECNTEILTGCMDIQPYQACLVKTILMWFGVKINSKDKLR